MSTVYRIHGEVRNTSTGLGVAGLGIELTQGTNEVPTYSYLTTSAADGSFSWVLTVAQIEYIYRRPSDGFWRDSVKMKLTARQADNTVVGTLSFNMQWGTLLQEPLLGVSVSVSNNGNDDTVDPTKPTVLVVTGQVVEPDGLPIANASVALKQKKLRSEPLLKSVSAASDGTFRIEYDALSFFKNGKLDLDVVLVASISGTEIGRSQVYCSPDSPLEVSVVRGGAVLVGPTLLDSLLQAIGPHLEGVAIQDLSNSDLDLLSCKVVQGRGALVRLRQAYRLSATSPWASGGAANAFEAKAFFAWLFLEPNRTFESFLFAQEAWLRLDVQIARDRREIGWNEGDISDPSDGDDALLEQLLDRIANAHDDILIGDEDSFFAKLIAAAQLPGALPDDLLTRYFQLGSQSAEAFWKSYEGTSYADAVAALHFALDVLAAVGTFFPLITVVCTARAQDGAELPNGRALARVSRAQWVQWVDTTGAPPWIADEVSSGSADSKAAYVEWIEMRLGSSNPGETLTGIDDLPPGSTTGAFDPEVLLDTISDNPDLDILVAPFDDIVFTGDESEIERAKLAVRIARRLDAIVPSRGRVELIGRLNAKGIAGPVAIVQLGRERFLDLVADSIAPADAQYIYRKSEQIATISAGLLLRHVSSGKAAGGLVGLSDGPMYAGAPPAWAALFGSPDACICDDARSVFSPGAYLSDLLDFEPKGVGALPPIARLDYRRPDLRKIRLGHANTFTELPAIDLNIELLEAYLLRGVASSIPHADDYIEDVASWQTTRPSVDLMVHPERMQELAYQKLAEGSFAPARWSLPFNLAEREHLHYSKYLGIDVAQLAPKFNNNDDDFLFQVVLGIPPGAVSSLLDGDNSTQKAEKWGMPSSTSDAQLLDIIRTGSEFVTRSGLSLAQGLEILRSQWVGVGSDWKLVVNEPCSLGNAVFMLDASPAVQLKTFHRLYRFFRLCRYLGWSVQELDLVLTRAIGSGDLTRAALTSILDIKMVLNKSKGGSVETVLAALGYLPLWSAESYTSDSRSLVPATIDLLDRGAIPRQRGTLVAAPYEIGSLYQRIVEEPVERLMLALEEAGDRETFRGLLRTEHTKARLERALIGGGVLSRVHGQVLAAAWGISLETLENIVSSLHGGFWDDTSPDYALPTNLETLQALYRPVALAQLAGVTVETALAGIRARLIDGSGAELLSFVELASELEGKDREDAAVRVFEIASVASQRESERVAAQVLPYYQGLAGSIWAAQAHFGSGGAEVPNLTSARARLDQWLLQLSVSLPDQELVRTFVEEGDDTTPTSIPLSTRLAPLVSITYVPEVGTERWHPLYQLTVFDRKLRRARSLDELTDDPDALAHDALARTLYLLDVLAPWYVIRTSEHNLPNLPAQEELTAQLEELLPTATNDEIEALISVVLGGQSSLGWDDQRLLSVYRTLGIGRSIELVQHFRAIESSPSNVGEAARVVAARKKYALLVATVRFARSHLDGLAAHLAELWKISPELLGEWISGRLTVEPGAAFGRGETDRRLVTFAEPEVVRAALGFGLVPERDAEEMYSQLQALPLDLNGTNSREALLFRLSVLTHRAELFSAFGMSEHDIRALFGSESKSVAAIAENAVPTCWLHSLESTTPTLHLATFLRFSKFRRQLDSMPIGNLLPSKLRKLAGENAEAVENVAGKVKWAIVRRLVAGKEKLVRAGVDALATLLETPSEGLSASVEQMTSAHPGNVPTLWWATVRSASLVSSLLELSQVATKQSITFGDLTTMLTPDPANARSTPPRRVRKVKTLALSGVTDPGKRKKLIDVRNIVREEQRDALVSFLTLGGNSAGLSSMMLTDVMVNSCVITSRIRSAMLAAQTYVNRVSLQMEQGVTLSEEQATQWDWMRRYRVWEAARKVALYPENWLEPEFRKDTSEAFDELATSLSTGDATNDSAEDLYRTYLLRVAEVRNLRICGIWQTKASAPGEQDVVHLVGRTRVLPYRHYYRTFVGGSKWTAWESIPFEIPASDVVLFDVRGRLHLAWSTMEQVVASPPSEIRIPPSDSSSKKEPTVIETDVPSFAVRITYSAYEHGAWRRPQTSLEQLVAKIQLDDEPTHVIWATAAWQIHLTPVADGDGPFRIDVSFQHSNGDSPMEDDASDGRQSYDSRPNNHAPRRNGPPSGGQVSKPKFHAPPGMYHVGCFAYDSCRGELANEGERDSDLDILRNPDASVKWWQLGSMYDATINSQHLEFDFRSVGAVLIPGFYDGESVLCSPWASTKPDDTWSVLHPQLGLRRGDVSAPFVIEALGQTLLVFPEVDEVSVPGRTNTAGRSSGGTIYLQPTGRVRAIYLLTDGVVCPVLETVERYGLQSLLSPEMVPVPVGNTSSLFRQSYYRRIFGFRGFVPGGNGSAPVFYIGEALGPVQSHLPAEEFNFSAADPRSNYHWEMFVHLPMLIADTLQEGGRYEDAKRWLEYMFDPKLGGVGQVQDAPRAKYWRAKPLAAAAEGVSVARIVDTLRRLPRFAGNPLNSPNLFAAEMFLVGYLGAWERDPFNPHAAAQVSRVSYCYAIVRKYVELLVAWGDSLFGRNSAESVEEAGTYYLTAARVLGPYPALLARSGSADKAVEEIEGLPGQGLVGGYGEAMEDTQDAVVTALPRDPENARETLSGAPYVQQRRESSLVAMFLSNDSLAEAYFCFPPNSEMLEMWKTVADRLYKFRNCLALDGTSRQLPLFDPPIDPALLISAALSGNLSDAVDGLYAPLPHQRFAAQLGVAKQFAAEVRSLGGAVLAAAEKQDGEHLANLRARHEVNLLERGRRILKSRVDEAKEGLAASNQTRAATLARASYYEGREYMNGAERRSMEEYGGAHDKLEVVHALTVLAAAVSIIPDIQAGTSGNGLHSTFEVSPRMIAGVYEAASRAIGADASQQQASASILATEGNYQRRSDDWQFQGEQARLELARIDREIKAAEIRLRIAEYELERNDLQTAQSREAYEYMSSKFTSEELYRWMYRELRKSYGRLYRLALELARGAEHCFNYELALDRRYISASHWDKGHGGLLAGEQLTSELLEMEAAYVQANRREYELTKRVSLREIQPVVGAGEETWLDQLQRTGKIDPIELSEDIFKLDHPSHYMRRIKTVSVTIPAVTGPYTNVGGTLTLLTSKTRRIPDSDAELEVDRVSASQSIALSSGVEDSGLFETSMQDPRYLPFEGRGVVSTWRLELAHDEAHAALQQFDYTTISDVILTIRYTAREGGQVLRDAVLG